MIKTIIVYENELEFDDKVNMEEADPKKSVFATQTHVNEIHTSMGTKIQYTAVIFYKVRL